MRRVICMILAVVMACSLFCTAAGAVENKQNNTYSYVAIGDSIAAGYGLSKDTMGVYLDDPAMFLDEGDLEHPLENAYPAVFGEMIAQWGSEYGYDVTTANLACTAYRAIDVERTILDENYKGKVLEKVLGILGGDIEGDPLAGYHDIYLKYLTDADLISIHLGANDVLMGVMEPMYDADNPILEAICYTMVMLAMGEDNDTALNAGMDALNRRRDEINYQTYSEAVTFLQGFFTRAEACIGVAAENVSGVIDAVRSVNSDADIAVVNMYNPYGNSLELDGQIQNLQTILSDILARSGQYLAGMDRISGRAISIGRFGLIVGADLAYPLQYMFGGKTLEGLITSLNDELRKVAEEAGVTYVDIYGITNECNPDPHPDAEHHREIAGVLADSLYTTVLGRMGAAPVILGDTDGDGEVTILDATAIRTKLALLEVSSYNEKAADADGDGEVTILDATAIQRWLAKLSTGEGIGGPLKMSMASIDAGQIVRPYNSSGSKKSIPVFRLTQTVRRLGITIKDTGRSRKAPPFGLPQRGDNRRQVF